MLKNAIERQCFGQFMKFSKIASGSDEHSEIMSSRTVHEVCANGLLMLRAGVTNGSLTFSLYGYVAYDADTLKVYETLGVDPVKHMKKVFYFIQLLYLVTLVPYWKTKIESSPLSIDIVFCPYFTTMSFNYFF